MIKDENKIYTQSIRAAGWVAYKTGIFPVIEILDKGNTFVFNKTEEVIRVLNEYKRSQYNKTPLTADINAYDEIVKKLKYLCKKSTRSQI